MFCRTREYGVVSPWGWQDGDFILECRSEGLRSRGRELRFARPSECSAAPEPVRPATERGGDGPNCAPTAFGPLRFPSRCVNAAITVWTGRSGWTTTSG